MGVSWRLVEAAAALASREGHRQLYYWVGVDNGRAVGFAKTGFRSTGSRRPSRVADLALGDCETALVLSLVPTTHRCPTRPATSWHPGRARSAESTAGRSGRSRGYPRSGDLFARRFLKRPEGCDKPFKTGSGEVVVTTCR